MILSFLPELKLSSESAQLWNKSSQSTKNNFLDKQIEALDCQILEYYEKFDCYLHTIPGIGMIAAATILAEIGDINRFKSSSALVAFAGIDPTVRQSGEFSSTHNHMSKRGSPYLRHAIFLAATTCSFHNSPLNAYYKKKRELSS